MNASIQRKLDDCTPQQTQREVGYRHLFSDFSRSPSLETMNPYEQIFFPIMGLGFSVAVVASFVAGWSRTTQLSTTLLLIAIVTFWAAMFIGSDMGFRVWQSIPNPPPEAFHDSFPSGALFLGWFPSGIFCGIVFLLTRLIRISFSPQENKSA